MENKLVRGASSSLLSKYTTLTDAIATTRDDIAKIQSDMALIDGQMTTEKSYRQKIERDLRIRRQESRNFLVLLHGSASVGNIYHSSRQDLNCRLFQQQRQNEAQKLQQLELLRNQISAAGDHRKSMQNRFIHSCRRFQMVGGRLRDKVALELLEDAYMRTNDSKNCQPPSQAGTSDSANIFKKELNRMQERVQESSNEKRTIFHSYNNVQSRMRSFEKRRTERKKNLAQQRGQLDRVRRDVSIMAADLNKIERETREIIRLNNDHAKEYERRKKRNWAQQNNSACSSSFNGNGSTVMPTPFEYNKNYNLSFPLRKSKIRNPYIKTKATFPSSINCGLDNDTEYEKSSLERQHPHRAGRIRVDRQFTTDISIGCATGGNEFDTRSIEEADRRGIDTEISKVSHSDEELDPKRFASRKATNMGEKKSNAQEEVTHSTGDNDSGEEDDDLLLFEPFKRSPF